MKALPPVLLFDLDDTILDDTGARDRCWQTACVEAAAQRPGLDAERLFGAIGEVREVFWSDPDRHRKWRPRMREAWERIATEALARVGSDDPALGAFIGQRHSELRDSAIAPVPGAISTLGRLQSLGVTLGLITNGGSDGQRAKIQRFALTAYFTYIGIEGEVGVGKPHRGAYDSALASLGVTAVDCWMVGDKLDWDVAGAQAVGIRGVWLDRRGAGLPQSSTIQPDDVIGSINELLPSA